MEPVKRMFGTVKLKLTAANVFVCFFGLLVGLFEFFGPLENFSSIWRRHHCRWRAANFDLCSVLMVIEQWEFFSAPHLLWHGTSVYNCHLRESVKLTPIAERFAEQSLTVLRLRSGFEHLSFRLRGEFTSNPLRHRSRLWNEELVIPIPMHFLYFKWCIDLCLILLRIVILQGYYYDVTKTMLIWLPQTKANQPTKMQIIK